MNTVFRDLWASIKHVTMVSESGEMMLKFNLQIQEALLAPK